MTGLATAADGEGIGDAGTAAGATIAIGTGAGWVVVVTVLGAQATWRVV